MAWGLSESHSGYEGIGENMDLHTETWRKYLEKFTRTKWRYLNNQWGNSWPVRHESIY